MTPDPVLAGATIALAAATLLLVIVGGIAAWAALKQLKSATVAASANESVVADHVRRRGEATIAAFVQFEKIYSTEHAELLALARKEQMKIKDLLALHPNGDALMALQKQLDALEMLGLGVRMRIFDVNVIYQAGRSIINQLWDRSSLYRTDLVAGHLDTRPAQPSAYEHGKWLHDELNNMSSEGPVHLVGTLPSID